MTRKGIFRFFARLFVSLFLLAAIFGGQIILLVFVSGRFAT